VRCCKVPPLDEPPHRRRDFARIGGLHEPRRQPQLRPIWPDPVVRRLDPGERRDGVLRARPARRRCAVDSCKPAAQNNRIRLPTPGSRLPSFHGMTHVVERGDHRGLSKPACSRLALTGTACSQVIRGNEDSVSHERAYCRASCVVRRAWCLCRSIDPRHDPEFRRAPQSFLYAVGRSGEFTISVFPRVPARPRDNQARGKSRSRGAAQGLGDPLRSRSRIAAVASGVTSSSVRPVPPVVSRHRPRRNPTSARACPRCGLFHPPRRCGPRPRTRARMPSRESRRPTCRRAGLQRPDPKS